MQTDRLERANAAYAGATADAESSTAAWTESREAMQRILGILREQGIVDAPVDLGDEGVDDGSDEGSD